MTRIFIKSIKNLIVFIRGHEILCLFSLIYFVYLISSMSTGAGDTIPASLLPFSILENHNLYLDQFYYYFESNSLLPFAREIDGHLLSFYPIVTPVLITPLYVLAFLFIKINNIPLDMFNPAFGSIVLIMGKLSSSLIASFSAIFVFLSLKELTNKRIATIVTLIFAFAANTWAISSRELWQHGLVELFLAMSIYLVLINEKQKSKMNIIYLGLISGFFIFNRPPDSILLIPIIYYILTMKDRRIIYYFSFMALSSAPFFLYNMHYFGSFFGGYADLASAINLNYKMITGFVGLLASPSRGIFIYTPIIIFSIAGYLKVFKLSNNIVKNFLLIFGISILGQILIYSAFVIWWGGWSYGPRFLTGMLPVLFIFLGLYLKDTHMNIKQKKNLLKILIFSILLIWSIFVQFVGAFYYPNGGWDGSPSVDLHPERLWHWNDTQIMRSFNAGITSPGNCIKTLQTIVNPPQDIVAKGNLGKGWYGIETWDGTSTRWMKNDSLITIYSPENRIVTLGLNALSFYRNRTLEISSNGVHLARVAVLTGFVNVSVPMYLAKGQGTIHLHVPEGCERPCDIKELSNPDSRCLSIAIQNVTVT